MIKKIFFTPGIMLLSIVFSGKKKNYRSTRSRATLGLGVMILSLICWLAMAGAGFYAVDKAGWLKKALDVGVEVVGVNGPQDEINEETETNDKPVMEVPEANASNTAQGTISSGAEGTKPTASGGGETSPKSTSPESKIKPQAAKMWLVILHSIPKNSREEADRLKRQYISKGLEVDVLDTDAFPRLLSGHWIVALGPYDNKNSATEAATQAAKFNSKLMVRQGM